MVTLKPNVILRKGSEEMVDQDITELDTSNHMSKKSSEFKKMKEELKSVNSE